MFNENYTFLVYITYINITVVVTLLHYSTLFVINELLNLFIFLKNKCIEK